MTSTLPSPPGLDKPLYTISVAAEILQTHPRTLMMYENLGLVAPRRTPSNRRRYTHRNVLTLQVVQRLTREYGLNLNGARYIIELIQWLDAKRISRPEPWRDLDVQHAQLLPRSGKTDDRNTST